MTEPATTVPPQTPRPARPVLAAEAVPVRGRGWAVAGVGAGLAAIGTMVSSSLITGVYDEALFGNPEAIQARLADEVPQMVTFHVFTVASAVLMLVFAAGLQHRVRAAVGDGSIATLASNGLVGTAVVAILGSALDTEFIFGIPEDDMIQPANAAFFSHWVGTVPWCWVLTGVSALAVYVASRGGALPRWLGLTSLVLGVLTIAAGISPLQYLAGGFGPLWLLVIASGFVLGDRPYRQAAG